VITKKTKKPVRSLPPRNSERISGTLVLEIVQRTISKGRRGQKFTLRNRVNDSKGFGPGNFSKKNFSGQKYTEKINIY